ncbi:hypothetical protein MLD38_024143 [Melastoma candidum]|uniref:Uncharacterized protein n=1 Tax=Melastoma candidum TaxID=119954 RepID=A0ACB9NT31_9MYRT|nr:hypothetical protein MLD38_024143 [Melastoma candidum]
MEMGDGSGMLHLGKQGHSHSRQPSSSSSSSLGRSRSEVHKRVGIPLNDPNHIPPSSDLCPFSADNSPPPSNSHRGSNSDIPFLYFLLQPSPSLTTPPSIPSSASAREESSFPKSQGDAGDDLSSAYVNFDGVIVHNSSCTRTTDEKSGNETHEDFDSRASGSKTNGDDSDNEAESSIKLSVNRVHRTGLSSDKRDGAKQSAYRHFRSVSMDNFMGKLKFADVPPKLPQPPELHPGQVSPRNSLHTNSDAFSLEFGDIVFSEAEKKEIMANEKLAEIALTDPKRMKRILANRQSAARSKERKTRYIQELEHKVQTLQTEATALSVQLTLLQRDTVGLTNQNNELKFRLQAMEQQAQLRNELNEALNAEVQRLKLSTVDIRVESRPSEGMEDT